MSAESDQKVASHSGARSRIASVFKTGCIHSRNLLELTGSFLSLLIRTSTPMTKEARDTLRLEVEHTTYKYQVAPTSDDICEFKHRLRTTMSRSTSSSRRKPGGE